MICLAVDPYRAVALCERVLRILAGARGVTESYPNRIDAGLIDHVDRLEITLLAAREYLESYRFRRWTEEKIIGRIPGSTR